MKSDDEIRDQVCTGKRKHLTKRRAQEAIRDIRASGRAVGKLKAYRCPFCNGLWHVGHRPPADILTSLRDRLKWIDGESGEDDSVSR